MQPKFFKHDFVFITSSEREWPDCHSPIGTSLEAVLTMPVYLTWLIQLVNPIIHVGSS